MEAKGLRADLHVHSKNSNRPSQWILQKLGCPESFTQPLEIYRQAKKKGMDLVTISDHNTIEGALEIAHLEDAFISEEVTSYFPEDGCKLHVLTLDITEAQHEDISRIRENVYDLVSYLNQEGIIHVLAHPLFDINHKLTFSHFEKMLLLFTHFEANGARERHQNRALESMLQKLGPEKIKELAEKHNIKPNGDTPWIKTITGGSDDHSSLNIARMYTFVEGARTKDEFFESLSRGKSRAMGDPSTPETMAHNLYGIAYQYYKHTFKLERWVESDALLGFVDHALTLAPRTERPKGLLSRVQEFFISRKNASSIFRNKDNALTELVQQKGRAFLAENKRLQEILRSPGAGGEEKEKIWFHFVNEVSEQIIRHLGDTSLTNLSQARLFNIFQTIGSAGSVYSLIAPYFMSYRLFARDRQFAENCHLHLTGRGAHNSQKKDKSRIYLFTDTYHETNGVALTIQKQLAAARKNSKELHVITCSPARDTGGAVNFNPIGSYELPIYPEIKLYYPPFLKILKHCFRNPPTQIHASTPGPMGLCALVIGRTLDIPVYGTYHTAFPQYAFELTGDTDIELVMWKAMTWFYNQMDIVYVPSEATGRELCSKGVNEKKIRLYPRGIDTRHFRPDRKNGIWTSEYGLDRRSLKLLYVGRLSKEKKP